MAIEGSLEVITSTAKGLQSTSQRVKVASLDSIPAVLTNNFGVTAITSAPAVTVGSVTSAGAWSCTKAGATANARLWADIPFEETAIGKALAAGVIDPLHPDGEAT